MSGCGNCTHREDTKKLVAENEWLKSKIEKLQAEIMDIKTKALENEVNVVKEKCVLMNRIGEWKSYVIRLIRSLPENAPPLPDPPADN